jgi:hypothetical protein
LTEEIPLPPHKRYAHQIQNAQRQYRVLKLVQTTHALALNSACPTKTHPDHEPTENVNEISHALPHEKYRPGCYPQSELMSKAEGVALPGRNLQSDVIQPCSSCLEYSPIPETCQ